MCESGCTHTGCADLAMHSILIYQGTVANLICNQRTIIFVLLRSHDIIYETETD